MSRRINTSKCKSNKDQITYSFVHVPLVELRRNTVAEEARSMAQLANYGWGKGGLNDAALFFMATVNKLK